MLAQLRKNLALLYAAEMTGKVLGLVVFGYLTRALGQERYGNLEFALGVLFLLNLVIDAGLGHYGAREAAKKPEDVDRLVGQIAIVRGALIVLSVLLLIGTAWVVPVEDGIARVLIILQGLVLLPAPFVLTWVFQARDEMHVVALASVIRQVLLAVGVLIFVRGPEDVLAVPIWDAVGLGAATALQVVLFYRAGGVIAPFRFLEGLGRVVRESAPLAASSVVWAVRLFSPLLALGVFTTAEQVGIFGAGHRLVIAGHTFVWLYFFNILPTLSRLGTEPGLERFGTFFSTSMRLVGWVALAGASLGATLSPVVIPLIYGEGMVETVEPFAIMIWMLAVAFVSGHHRFGLIALSLQKEEFWASAAGAAVALVACIVAGSGLTPARAAVIFVLAEATTLVFAVGALRVRAPAVPSFEGLGRPIGFVGVASVVVAVWSPAGALATAAGLAAFYGVSIIVLERAGVRELIALRSAPAASDQGRPVT